ncbi:MAG: extracellular solute-binding protein [Thermoplasmatales archaeon]|nr:extracellular solute-binding protein [Thermoplasmatales archaeon]
MDTTVGGSGTPSKKRRTALIVGIVVVIVVIAAVAVTLAYLPHKTIPSASKVTITVWDTSASGGESTAFNTSLALFEAAHKNVTVDVTYGVSVGSTNFVTDATSGTAPNVYRDSSDNGGSLYAGGLLVNLSRYLPSTVFANYTSGTISDFTLNGAVYGLPVNTNGIAMYYNKALLPNGQPPTTTGQMIQDAINVTNMGSSYLGMPYDIGATSGYRFAAWFPAFGGEIFNSTGYPMLNSTPDIAAMSWVWNWTVKYHVSQPGLSGESDEQAYFESNHSAFMFDGPWDQSTYQKTLGSNLGVTAIPIDNATGLWPQPLWGSIGYLVANSKASGASSAQIWASVHFVEEMTNYTAQLNLYTQAGDLPALTSVGTYVSAHPGNDPLISGWITQEEHTQKFPNIPQMAYYWTPFGIGASNLEQNASTTSGITPASVMNSIESQIISDLKTNGVPLTAIDENTALLAINSTFAVAVVGRP